MLQMLSASCVFIIYLGREVRYWRHPVLSIFLETILFHVAFGRQQNAFPGHVQRCQNLPRSFSDYLGAGS